MRKSIIISVRRQNTFEEEEQRGRGALIELSRHSGGDTVNKK